MTALVLVALLWAPARAEEPDMSSDVDIRRELEKAETGNLENAAANAEAESARTARLTRGLLTASLADVESARVELEGLLRDPEELRRQLGAAEAEADPVEALEGRQEALALSGQLLAAKAQDFLVKASSVPLPAPEEERAKQLALRASYNSRNRELDLKRAQADAAAAAKRLGVKDPWPSAAQALAALDGCVAEVRSAAGQAEAAAKLLAPGGKGHRERDPAGPAGEAAGLRARALAQDAKDLEREAGILRADLLLRKADRQIRGGR